MRSLSARTIKATTNGSSSFCTEAVSLLAGRVSSHYCRGLHLSDASTRIHFNQFLPFSTVSSFQVKEVPRLSFWRRNCYKQKRCYRTVSPPCQYQQTAPLPTKHTKRLQEETDKLLQSSSSSSSSSHWTIQQQEQATVLLRDWISLSPSIVHTQSERHQQFIESWRLWTRLAETAVEQQKIQSPQTTNDVPASSRQIPSNNGSVVNLDVLAKVLLLWERTLPMQSSNSDIQILTPRQMVSQLETYQNQLPLQLTLTTQIYNTILKGYEKMVSQQPKAPPPPPPPQQQQQEPLGDIKIAAVNESIELIKHHMVDQHKHRQSEPDPVLISCAPNRRSIELVLQICTKAGALSRVLELLDYLVSHQQRKSDNENILEAVRLGSHTFESLFRACAVQRGEAPSTNDGGQLAEAILNRMIQCHEQGFLARRPQVEHYTQVMQAWTKSQHPQSAQRCLEILQSLQYQARQNKKFWLEPDTIAYGTVLDALAKSGRVQEAEALLEYMWQQHHNSGNHRNHQKEQNVQTRPSVAHFNIVLNAYAKSASYNAGERAEALLRFLQQQQYQQQSTTTTGNAKALTIRPDKVSFESTIRAWGASGHPSASERAEQLFQEMVDATDERSKPDTRTCAALLHVWAKNGNVEKAARLLGDMFAEFKENGNARLEPNIQCFAVVLDAFAKSKHPLAGQEAEALLRKMVQAKQPNLAPTTFCYNSVISAYASSGDRFAGHEAERLLREMSREDQASCAAPDLITYNSTISAFARAKKAVDAERILVELQRLSDEKPHLMPTTFTYNCVLNAHAKNGNPKAVEMLLTDMDKWGVRPDAISLSLAIEAWSRSGRPESGVNADMYLERMERYPEKQMERRYRLAHMCWRNSHGHHPNAEKRMKELGEVLTQIQSHI